MYHKIVVAGIVGREPEMKYLSNGDAVTNFSLAVTDGFGDKKKTIWVRVTVWGKRAETANTYIQKGQKILVEGKLTSNESGNPRSWMAKDGNPASAFEITASDFVFIGTKGSGAEGTQAGNAPVVAFEEEDEVPF